MKEKINIKQMKKNYKFLIALSVIIIGLIAIYFYNSKEEVYTLKCYDSKTKITDISEYVIRDNDTVFHGKFNQYNEKGIKIAEGNFVNGEPNGKSIYYFDDGKIKSVHYRINSKITLESCLYYPNGKIERYALYNPVGESIFIVNYDENGVVKNYDGDPQIEIYQFKFAHKKQFNIKEDQRLKVKDILKHSYIVANIPYAKRSFKIENVGVDNSKVKRTQKNILPAQIDVEEVLIKKGKNTIRSIVRYEFNDKITPVLSDTISFDVNVN